MSKSHFKFTEGAIDRLPNPKHRTRWYDSFMPGLVLDVTPKGHKAFRVYKKLPGNRTPLNVTLGAFPALSVDQARKLARKAMADMADGVNPNDSKRSFRASAVTVREAYQTYVDSKPLKATTRKGYDQIMSCYLKDWRDKRLADITEEAVLKRHQKLTNISPAQADYVMRTLRALFNFARAEYKSSDSRTLFPHNPVAVISEKRAWNNVARRQTRLRPSQLKPLLETITRMRDEALCYRQDFTVAVCDFVEFMVFTGLRKTELLELKWENVYQADELFWIGETKNGLDVELPITEPLATILERRASFRCSGYVFGMDNSMGRVVEPKKVVQRINEQAGLSFTLHDLRRTYCSIAESLGTGTYTLKRLLNHKTARGDVTAGYTVLTAEELKEPAKKIATRIEEYAGRIEFSDRHNLGLIKDMLERMNKTERMEIIGLLVSGG